MRKQTSRYLLLGFAFGVQLLTATKGYSNRIGYANDNPLRKSSSANKHSASETVKKENVSGLKDPCKNVEEKISGKVTGPDGKPLTGVSVQIKGSKNGVLT